MVGAWAPVVHGDGAALVGLWACGHGMRGDMAAIGFTYPAGTRESNLGGVPLVAGCRLRWFQRLALESSRL